MSSVSLWFNHSNFNFSFCGGRYFGGDERAAQTTAAGRPGSRVGRDGTCGGAARRVPRWSDPEEEPDE